MGGERACALLGDVPGAPLATVGGEIGALKVDGPVVTFGFERVNGEIVTLAGSSMTEGGIVGKVGILRLLSHEWVGHTTIGCSQISTFWGLQPSQSFRDTHEVGV